jgi:transcriptional regulator MraZ
MVDMLLTGNYERSLDEKLRLALPKQFRELLTPQGPLVLTLGTDNSLALFSQSAFASLAEKLAARSPTGHDVRAYSRLLYAQSHSVEVDSQGRIRLPAELARMAGLEEAVVLLGVGDRVELWNKASWDAYLADLSPRFDQLAESALSDSPAVSNATVSQTELTSRPMQPR